MFFLLRMAFWIGLVCVLVPSANKDGSPIDAGQALTVANAAVSDARGFCERQPQACVAGGQVASALGQKAEAGARTLFQLISEKLTEKPADKPAAQSVSAAGHGTLTANDLQPAYHQPVPLPPKREKPARPAV
jgi:Family of unknown function (DUF5330)